MLDGGPDLGLSYCGRLLFGMLRSCGISFGLPARIEAAVLAGDEKATRILDPSTLEPSKANQTFSASLGFAKSSKAKLFVWAIWQNCTCACDRNNF